MHSIQESEEYLVKESKISVCKDDNEESEKISKVNQNKQVLISN